MRSGPKLRLHREALAPLTTDELYLVAAGDASKLGCKIVSIALAVTLLASPHVTNICHAEAEQ